MIWGLKADTEGTVAPSETGGQPRHQKSQLLGGLAPSDAVQNDQGWGVLVFAPLAEVVCGRTWCWILYSGMVRDAAGII